MEKIKLDSIYIYRFDIFKKQKRMLHFISTRNTAFKKDFSLCLSAGEDIPAIIENRKKLAENLGIPLSQFVFQQQQHTNHVKSIYSHDKGRGSENYYTALKDNDGMVCNDKGICITVIGGDCVPVLFYDPVKDVIAAAHSGWRGTAKRISGKVISEMEKNFGCDAANILVGIGPSIGPDIYEVDRLVFEAFSKTFEDTSQLFKPAGKYGKFYLDLWTANKLQLIEAGVSEKNIEVAGICTFANNNDFFSARRNDSGRFACGIMLH
jgi:polyphenol oxidase